MSVNDAIRSSDGDLAALPNFDLCFAFDDDEAPRWVTVYSEVDDEFTTQWLSMRADLAVGLDQIA